LTNYHFLIRSNPSSRIGWLRKFERIYNPTLAVETLANLNLDFPHAKLIMGGGDAHDGSSDEVKKVAIEKKLLAHLDIQGFIEHAMKFQWFDSFDVFINTTNVESFGIAVLEAAASGSCIVSTNVGELPYIWEDGKEVLLVVPDDPKAMSAAIRRILTEPGLAEWLSINARKKAEQYDWSVILPQWEKLFKKVIVDGQ
jgi:glycosyltransferase involved in cell wall biosynthesis